MEAFSVLELEAGFSWSKELLGRIRQKGRTEAGQGTTPPCMVSHRTSSLSSVYRWCGLQDKLLPDNRGSGLPREGGGAGVSRPLGDAASPVPVPRAGRGAERGDPPHGAGR